MGHAEPWNPAGTKGITLSVAEKTHRRWTQGDVHNLHVRLDETIRKTALIYM